MDKIDKTYILINSLGGGGAERQISYISQLDSIDKIICIEPLVSYDIPKEKLIFLTNTLSQKGLIAKLFHSIEALNALRKLNINRHVHLICFLQLSTILGVICKLIYNCRLTLSIRINPFMHGQNKNAHTLSSKALSFMFKKANHIVPNSIETANDIKQHYPQFASKVSTIVNGYDIQTIQAQSNNVINEYHSLLTNHICLLNAGRMDSQKGHWHLLRIFSKLKESHPHSLKLILLGQGIMHDELIALAQNLNLRVYQKDKDDFHHDFDVYFLGFVKNPYFFYKHATLFVFPSIYEGLPNVIIESLICETPVISTNCKSGPFEILFPESTSKYEILEPTETPFGYIMPTFSGQIIMNTEPLIEGEQEWVNTCLNLLQNPVQLTAMKKNCQHIQKKYNLTTIQQQWEQFLKLAAV